MNNENDDFMNNEFTGAVTRDQLEASARALNSLTDEIKLLAVAHAEKAPDVADRRDAIVRKLSALKVRIVKQIEQIERLEAEGL